MNDVPGGSAGGNAGKRKAMFSGSPKGKAAIEQVRRARVGAALHVGHLRNKKNERKSILPQIYMVGHLAQVDKNVYKKEYGGVLGRAGLLFDTFVCPRSGIEFTIFEFGWSNAYESVCTIVLTLKMAEKFAPVIRAAAPVRVAHALPRAHCLTCLCALCVAAQNTQWHPELQIDADINWPKYDIFFSEVGNFLRPTPPGVPPSPPTTVLALFGFVAMFASKITGDAATLAGGTWTSIANFTAPELSTEYLAFISDANADDYDVDLIIAFFADWGFDVSPIELTQA